MAKPFRGRKKGTLRLRMVPEGRFPGETKPNIVLIAVAFPHASAVRPGVSSLPVVALRAAGVVVRALLVALPQGEEIRVAVAHDPLA